MFLCLSFFPVVRSVKILIQLSYKVYKILEYFKWMKSYEENCIRKHDEMKIPCSIVVDISRSDDKDEGIINFDADRTYTKR